MAPKLTQVNIAVRDMDAMAAFYERLGLSMAVGHPDWAAHHRSASGDDAPDVELDSVAFTSWWNEGWAANSGIVLGFEVPDRPEVDRLYGELTAAGATSQQAPYDAFWGALCRRRRPRGQRHRPDKSLGPRPQERAAFTSRRPMSSDLLGARGRVLAELAVRRPDS